MQDPKPVPPKHARPERRARVDLALWRFVVLAVAVDPAVCGAPSRSRFADNVVPLPADLVVGRALAAADTAELVADLASEGGRPDDDDHHAEQREIMAK